MYCNQETDLNQYKYFGGSAFFWNRMAYQADLYPILEPSYF